MIYTVTLNPSLDYVAFVPNFQTGIVNRTEGEELFPGGKGINVSIVLHNMGIESCAFGFLAGFTGKEIQRRLLEMGCRENMIFLEEGYSRINVKLCSGMESEVNGRGPDISKEALDKLFSQLDGLREGDFLVLSGSIPSSLPDTVYRDMIKALEGRGIRTIVDAGRNLLANVLPCHPFLIKPNNHELGELFGRKLETKKEVLEYAGKLQQMGAENVLVSMAGEGAVFLDAEGKCYECSAPAGKVVNSVGAGDSMVAGFLAGYSRTGSFQEAFLTGVAAGSASAFSSSLAEGAAIEALLQRMKNY